MDKEVADKLISHLKGLLSTIDVTPQWDGSQVNAPHHLVWMCNEYRSRTTDEQYVWVGYLLGYMIAQGLVDVQFDKRLIHKILFSASTVESQ